MSLTDNCSFVDLREFIARCLEACGMPTRDAGTAADLMARADLMGQDGHGVFRLPMYVKRIRAGGMNMTPKFERLSERTATALIDGDNDGNNFVNAFMSYSFNHRHSLWFGYRYLSVVKKTRENGGRVKTDFTQQGPTLGWTFSF